MGKEKCHEHHVIPISLGGGDRLANRRVILQKDHDKIHGILSLKHKAIRTLRMQENEASLESDWKKYFEAQRIAQTNYFYHIEKLPNPIRQLHFESIRASIIDVLEQCDIKIVKIVGIHSQPENIDLVQIPSERENIFRGDINFGLQNLAVARHNLNGLNDLLKYLKTYKPKSQQKGF